MNRREFTDECKKHISELDDLIGKMPDRGRSCYDSQKVCIQAEIHGMYRLVDGIDKSDLRQLDED